MIYVCINNDTQNTKNTQTMQETLIMNKYSFRVAYDSLPRIRQREAREKLKDIFGITSEIQLYKRIDGEIEPKISQAIAVVNFFSKYGIEVSWSKDTVI